MGVENSVASVILPAALSWRERLTDPSLTALLILQLVVILILAPLAAMGHRPPDYVGLLVLSAQIAIVVLLTPSKRAALAVAFSLALSVGAVIFGRDQTAVAADWLNAGGQLVGRFAVGWVLVRAVFGPGRVNHHRIMGAVTLYLNIGLAFAAVYQLLAKVTDHALAANRPEDLRDMATMVYFSFVTLTTTGFGDIVPVNPIARGLANLETIAGQLFPATLLARIVTLELAHRGGEWGIPVAPPTADGGTTIGDNGGPAED